MVEHDDAPEARTTGAESDPEVAERVEEYRRQAADLAERAQTWIVEHPGYAVLGAATLGFLVARFVARRRA